MGRHIMTFKQWMNKVNQILESELGFDSTHFADLPWRSYFDDGVPAANAAGEIVSDPRAYI